MALIDPTTYLKREDKWYVGGGSMLIYAPPFPQYDAEPGYWDECHFGNLPIPHLLAVAIVEEGRELQPQLKSHVWFPDRSVYEYSLGDGLNLTMTRRGSAESTLLCELELRNGTAESRRVEVVLWTLRRTHGGGAKHLAREFGVADNEVCYLQEIRDRSPKPVAVNVHMGADRKPTSYQVTPAHSSPGVPEFEFTPFAESLRQGRLTNEVVGENVLGSVIYAGLHCQVSLRAKETQQLSAHIRVEHARTGGKHTEKAGTVESAKGKPDVAGAKKPSGLVPTWERFVALVPHFECSDEFLTRYYWYRWYGIWLNSLPGGVIWNYPYPAIAEGIDYFRGVITYSLMCHLREAKWLKDPALAQGCIRNHLAHQTRAGHFAGHIYASHVQNRVFYHTDWGGALTELMAHHADPEMEAEVYPALVRYLRYFQRERDLEGSNLFDVTDQYETGQEFSSRYFAASDKADLYGWENRLRMKGVDASFYMWRLADYLTMAAERVGSRSEAWGFARLADSIAAAVKEKMWDRERGFFFDYDEQKAERSPFWSAVGFYPAGSEIADEKMMAAALKHLFGKRKFGTPYPTPTSPVDDPYFSAEPRWRGERANCPWNGRVWPMVNSHIVEALGYAAEVDGKYRRKLASYLRRFVEMMFFDGDPRRPNCFEHYHPLDGSPCTYRGIDDYMHSWVADLILKYVAGVRTGAERLIVDPFPFGLDWFLLKDASVHGHRMDLEWNRDRNGRSKKGFRIRLDGETVMDAKTIKRWEIAW